MCIPKKLFITNLQWSCIDGFRTAEGNRGIRKENPLIFNFKDPAGQPSIIFIVVSAEQVTHAKVLDEKCGNSGRQLEFQSKRIDFFFFTWRLFHHIHSFKNAVMISYNYAEKCKDYVKQLKSMYYFLFYTTSKNIVATVVVFDLKNR